MMNKQTSVAYIDLLTVLFILFVVISALLLAVNKTITEGNVKSKAEFVVEMSWSSNSNSDMDLFVKNPNGDIAFFRSKDIGMMTLDRDNLGVLNNDIIGANGEKITDPNRVEITSIRAFMEGVHTVNVLAYTLRPVEPTTVKVRVTKLNPYKLIIEKEVTLTKTGEMATIVSFYVSKDGKVSNIDPNTSVKMLLK